MTKKVAFVSLVVFQYNMDVETLFCMIVILTLSILNGGNERGIVPAYSKPRGHA